MNVIFHMHHRQHYSVFFSTTTTCHSILLLLRRIMETCCGLIVNGSGFTYYIHNALWTILTWCFI